MRKIPRDVAQTLVTKLDLNHVTVKESKEFVLRLYGIALTGRTKAKIIREVCQNMEA